MEAVTEAVDAFLEQMGVVNLCFQQVKIRYQFSVSAASSCLKF